MSIHCPVADNGPEFLETVRQVLDRQGISIISVAANSAEAIARADLQPDAVLTDVHLGEASGLLLASRIAGLDQAGSPRVILISASPKDDVGKALPTGSTVEFVSETDLLATAIRTALGLTPDDQTAGGEQMRAMSRPHVRPATDLVWSGIIVASRRSARRALLRCRPRPGRAAVVRLRRSPPPRHPGRRAERRGIRSGQRLPRELPQHLAWLSRPRAPPHATAPDCSLLARVHRDEPTTHRDRHQVLIRRCRKCSRCPASRLEG